MRLIEADGINLDGNKYVPNLRLSPDQRYSVLITGKLNFSKSYWIRATIHPFNLMKVLFYNISMMLML
jgi:hypothetical protein